jgi:hypothetical protein
LLQLHDRAEFIDASTTQASLAHFRMKLFLAAPESFLPSALTAFGKHASRLHFLRKVLSAALLVYRHQRTAIPNASVDREA